MALSKIDTNAIADDAVDNTKLDLASNYDFTGTVTGAGESNKPAFHARLGATDTTTATDQTWVLMPIDTEDLDTDNAYTNTAGNYKFTVPSGKGGKYLIYYSVRQGKSNDLHHLAAAVYKNGSSTKLQSIAWDNNGTTYNVNSSNVGILDLSAGDYLQVYARNDVGSGTANIQTTGTHFGGYKIQD